MGHEASEHEADYQRSGPVLKKLKETVLSSENVEKSEAGEDLDKFSNLPNDLIDSIFSFMETKDAIRTAVLSKKWKDYWKSTSHLNLCSKPFRRLNEFDIFVKGVLSRHDSLKVLSLTYKRFGMRYATNRSSLNKVMKYATSRGVEDVRISLRGRNSGKPRIQLPPCLCNCQSLKRFELEYCQTPDLLSTFNCKSLETLLIGHCVFFPSPYGDSADFINLQSLHLNQIRFNSHSDLQEFVISAPKLNDLTLRCNRFDCKLVISTPKLTKFSYLDDSDPYSSLEFGLDYFQTPNLLLKFNCKSLETLRIGHCLLVPSPCGSFADFINLKSLHLNQIRFNSHSDLRISAPKLNDLTLMCNRFDCKLVILAPKLTKFSYLHSNPLSFLEFGIPLLHDLMIDIWERHDGLEKSCEKRQGKSLHGLINMTRGHDVAEDVKLSFRTVEVTCETAVLLEQEYPCSSKLKSLNLGAGSTCKVYIDELHHIIAYFRNNSECGDFKVVRM